jgi:two-component system CitB family response regulator
MDHPILLVEDNADHAVLVQAMLEYRGIESRVYVTQNVAEAKSYLLGEWPFDDPLRNPTPQLLVLDHWLDDGTGLELLEWLKGIPKLCEIPAVVFTGCHDAPVRRRAEELGVVGFFLKPEGFDALGEAIADFIEPTLRKGSQDEDQNEGSAQAG